MSTTENLKEFVTKHDFTQEKIDKFLISNKITEKQLVKRCFNLLNSIIPFINPDQDFCNLLSDTLDLLEYICEKSTFNKKEIEINKERVKKSREALLSLANKYDNYEILKIANRLDELVIDKNLEVPDLKLLIKKLIDRKEDVNIIKKLLSINKSALTSSDNELFNYVFNLAIDAINNDEREKFYYITLLKIFYTSKIDKMKYINELDRRILVSSPLSNEIYMIIHGIRRSLRPEEILDKYEVYDDLPKSNIYVPKKSLFDDNKLITIDSSDTYIRDDAISLKKDGNNYILGVYITDLPTKIQQGSDLDIYALNNFESKFLVGGKRTRLFHRDVERKLSLNEGAYRSVLALYTIINQYGEVKDYYFKPVDLKILKNLTYSECDKYIDNMSNIEYSKTLLDLYKIAMALEDKNSDRLKYWSLKNLTKNDMLRHTKSDTIVRESMILYNTLMTFDAKEKGIPFNYRFQDPEYISYLISQFGITINDYTRNLIKDIYLESKYSSEPRKHNGLNQEAYGQISAPLRRYPDFNNQQLYHHFALKDIPMDYSDERHLLLINYYNQRAEELSLMSAEYNREAKLIRKK